MKLSTVKKVLIAAVVFVLSLCFTVSSVVLNAGADVFADTSAGQDCIMDASETMDCTEQESEQDSELELERMNAAIREQYSDLVEYPYDDAVASEIEKTGTTVGEGLVNEICRYQEMLVKSTDEQEKSKIRDLIDATKDILDSYEAVANKYHATADSNATATVSSFTEEAVKDLASATVPLAIVYFTSVNYYLSSELLTRAWYQSNDSSAYEPVYGIRITGSPVTYDFVDSSETSKVIEYSIHAPSTNNTSTCIEEDLGFALHYCTISRSTAENKVAERTVVQVTDTYDFDITDSGISVLDDLVAIFVYAQEYNIIGNYEVEINVDVADPLYLQLEGTASGVHTVLVKNYTDKKITVLYNTKMCFYADALDWSSLSDFAVIDIDAWSSVEVKISENLLATSIAFCYIRNGYKIITYADELYYGERDFLDTSYVKSEFAGASSDVSILAKGGSVWAIVLTNTYGEDVVVEYNSKMCFESDAIDWSGLSDILSLNLADGETTIVLISENVFATDIAVRFTTQTHIYYVYADSLSSSGTMNMHRFSELVMNYLTLTNLGKSNGAWSIKITNPLNQKITVEYNTKMCYTSDAKSWSGLSDIATISISAYGSATVSISTNWFATAIAVSYQLNGYRIISYADGLNTSGGIQVYNCYI